MYFITQATMIRKRTTEIPGSEVKKCKKYRPAVITSNTPSPIKKIILVNSKDKENRCPDLYDPVLNAS